MVSRVFAPLLLLASCLSAAPVPGADPTNVVPATTVPATPVPIDSTSPVPAPSSSVTETPAVPDAAAEGTNAAPTHPFKQIAIRNAFAIKPPPPILPPPELPKPPGPPPPNVFLTGFSRSRGVQKVYLQVTRPGAKAPDYLDLRVGEQQSMADGDIDIKILEIDDRKETAKILNSGQEVVLSFKNNGLKPSGGPVPGPGGIPGPMTTAVNNGITTPRLAPPAGGGGPTMIGRGVTQVAGGNTGNGVFPGATSLPAGYQEGTVPTAVVRDVPARRNNNTPMTTTAEPVSLTEPRVINGHVIPPPPPLPGPNPAPGN